MDRARTMAFPGVRAPRDGDLGEGDGEPWDFPDSSDSDDADAATDATVELSPPRRRRRLTVVGALLVVAVVAAVVVRQGGGSDEEPAELAGGATATAPVEVRTLTETEEIEGTLGFGEVRGIAAGATGTVTSVAAEGSTVDRGGDLFAIDQHPTVLLVGAIPLYRDLAEGTADGADVAQLEENMATLGYTAGGSLVVDEHFDGATTEAVEAWQDDLGVEVTGRVTAADAVFLSGPARIGSPAVDVGAQVQPGDAVLEYTGSTRYVQAVLDPSLADLAHPDDQVAITLPDGTEVTGQVATVSAGGSSSSAGGDQNGTSSGEGEADAGSDTGSAEDTATIEVTITLDDQAPAEPYTTASVDVALTGRQRQDVLVVPVVALVAVPGSGYAVEVPREDGTTELVPVDPGMYADGYVEVTGDGIAEGTDVVVAAP